MEGILEFEDAFAKYVLKCKKISDAHNKENGFPCQEFSTKVGKKYIKVICNNSVHSFVNRENGNVFMAASWSSPAKHSRGNIFDEKNGTGMMGPYGPKTLKGFNI